MRSFLPHIVLLFFFCPCVSHAQIPLPFEIRQAIERGTRTATGLPGRHYFQNHSEYRMDVNFDPENGELRGEAQIVYYNESPDTLRRIYFRLYQNIAKKGEIRDEPVPVEDVNNGVRITKLRVDGQNFSDVLEQRIRIEGTTMILYLPEILSPNDSVEMVLHWRLRMPSTHLHRFGKYAASTWFVGYWYPQVSVYDDIYGWDDMNYTGTHEFYNDFNSFDVTVRVPAKHMVWATGDWKNADRVLSSEALNLFREAQRSDELKHIITSDDLQSGNHFQHSRSLDFRFTADHMPDFAFAVSDRYLWDAVSVMIDSAMNRRVTVSAVYPKDAPYFEHVAVTGAASIRHFSESSYGVPFPYPSVTVFNGEGGMEYPMIVNDGAAISLAATQFVTMHEIAHSYFPFMTGINERIYSWLDEGLTTYLPLETEEALHEDFYSLEHIVARYEQYAGTIEDVGLQIPAYQTRDFTYQVYSYLRPAMAFNMIEQYMGRTDFREAIRQFILTWEGKHPTGWDFLAVLQSHTEKDIGWMADSWLFGRGYADLAIERVIAEADTLSITISNKGGMPVPILLTFVYADKEEQVKIPLDVWKESGKYRFDKAGSEGILTIRLGSHQIPDKNRSDNEYSIPDKF